jgi:hypothetical protein
MAHWLHKIDCKEEWQQARSGEITAHELALKVAIKLEALSCFWRDIELRNIVDDLKNLPEDADFNDFDSVYDALCDWGDATVEASWPPTKMCWIGTF